jgi:hypothetical protein
MSREKTYTDTPTNVNELDVQKYTLKNGFVVVKTVVRNDASDPIPVTFDVGDPFNLYGSISSLAKSTETNIINYTVPVGKTLFLNGVNCSGENIAVYRVVIDGQEQEKSRSWWSNFNVDMSFNRFEVAAGESVQVKVIHESNEVGDFNAKIQGFLV